MGNTVAKVLLTILFGGILLYGWVKATRDYFTLPRNEKGEVRITYHPRGLRDPAIPPKVRWVPAHTLFADPAYLTIILVAIGWLMWRSADED